MTKPKIKPVKFPVIIYCQDLDITSGPLYTSEDVVSFFNTEDLSPGDEYQVFVLDTTMQVQIEIKASLVRSADK